MRKWYWCWQNHVNYEYSENLDRLLYRCMWLIDNCEGVKVEVTYHDIIITTENTDIELWNANKFYGWLSAGAVNGVEWKKVSPSLSAMYDFKVFLERRKINIYHKKVEGVDLSLDVNEINC